MSLQIMEKTEFSLGKDLTNDTGGANVITAFVC
jgi:hypothetical protein